MKTLLRRPVRASLILSTVVALIAFAARLAEAQPTPQRLTLGDAVRIAAPRSAPVQLRQAPERAAAEQARDASR